MNTPTTARSRRMVLLRLAALGGVVGPLLFALVVVVAGALRPEYSYVTQYISELGATATDRAYLLNAVGFIPTGLLLVAFAAALASRFPRSLSARIGTTGIFVLGLGTVGAGLFSCDAGCPAGDLSREAMLHNLVSLVAFTSGIIGCGAWALTFRGKSGWNSLWLYSALSAGIVLAFLVLMLTGNGPVGLWQRIFVGGLYLWCAVVGLRLLALSPRGVTDRPPGIPATDVT